MIKNCTNYFHDASCIKALPFCFCWSPRITQTAIPNQASTLTYAHNYNRAPALAPAPAPTPASAGIQNLHSPLIHISTPKSNHLLQPTIFHTIPPISHPHPHSPTPTPQQMHSNKTLTFCSPIILTSTPTLTLTHTTTQYQNTHNAQPTHPHTASHTHTLTHNYTVPKHSQRAAHSSSHRLPHSHTQLHSTKTLTLRSPLILTPISRSSIVPCCCCLSLRRLSTGGSMACGVCTCWDIVLAWVVTYTHVCVCVCVCVCVVCVHVLGQCLSVGGDLHMRVDLCVYMCVCDCTCV